MTKLVMLGLTVGALGAGAVELDKSVMADEYWQVWNDEAQAAIDADIEKYRKADGVFTLAGVPEGTEVKVEQTGHAFVFGASFFNYNQLGTKERNRKYRYLFGDLFNQATVPFYWRNVEPYPGSYRFASSYWDSEEFWNACAEPTEQFHWRRPATDLLINWCKARGVRIHGHPLAWSLFNPTWLWDEFCPEHEKRAIEDATGIRIPTRKLDVAIPFSGDVSLGGTGKWAFKTWCEAVKRIGADKFAELAPTFTKEFNARTFERIEIICKRFGSRVDSWDVINECTDEGERGKFPVKSGKLLQEVPRVGIRVGDLPLRAFLEAQKHLPETATLCINDWAAGPGYVRIVDELASAGAKIDVVGSQMHLFNPKESAKIAAGELVPHLTPKGLKERFDRLSQTGRPIHLSEITITAPGHEKKDEMVQAIITRDLYRAWFSQKNMMGITWWNVVDGCGYRGEPTISGIFTREMQPKIAYHVLDDLINREWKTKTTVKAGAGGKVAFRGFKGTYRLSWTDADGKPREKRVRLGK